MENNMQQIDAEINELNKQSRNEFEKFQNF